MAAPITVTATKITSIVTMVRNQLAETTARFWTDDELIAIMRLGALDLWGAILDLHQDHYFKIAKATLKANDTQLSNLPPDCFRIQVIEPWDTSSTATGRALMFKPRKYKDPEFAMARTLTAQDPSTMYSREICYQITGEGSPLGPPTVLTAPALVSDLFVRIAYNPSIWPADSKLECNPVPGNSDGALKAWTIAFARAKETEDRQPDAGWLGVYATDKQTLLTRLTPREEQEPEVVEDLFLGYSSY